LVRARGIHEQKKYFSLMLVPSYTSGKTRSIRISHRSIYAVLFSIAAIAVILTLLYAQSMFTGRVARYATSSLEVAQAAYANLQLSSSQELSLLMDNVVFLQNSLRAERLRSEEGLQQQQYAFLETLEAIWLYTEGLEMRLRGYEAYRQEIITQLSESEHIPVVRNLLVNIRQSEEDLLIGLDELQGFSTISRAGYDEETQLIYYIIKLEAALEAQHVLFTELKEKVDGAIPYILRDRYGPDLLEWSHVRNILPRNTPVMITDVRTGTTYWINSFSHGNHADVFPVSPEDTAALHSTFGGRWTWDTRPIWVHVGERKIAASINGMPHGGGGNRGNNMNGHVCIHFRGSRTHNGSLGHERDHQRSVTEAYRAGLRR